MHVRILGPLEVEAAQGRVELPGGRASSLLALLAIHVGTVISSERLIDELWGASPPATARTKLQGLVSSLRKRLEPDRRSSDAPKFLLTRAPGYVLALGPDRVDAHRFRRLVSESFGLPPAPRAELLREALDLWRGPALSDYTYEPFAQAEISSLNELRIVATENRITADLALDRHQELVPELERLVAAHPFREELSGQLMLALYRSGRQADALEVYRRTEATLREELGVEPGPTLQEMEQAILRQDPELEIESPPPVAEAETPKDSWLGESRRTVTVVFAELAGDDVVSDPERTHQAMKVSHTIATQIFEEYGGVIQGLIGGVMVAVFGIPHAHEDDALRAARAAVRLKQELASVPGRAAANLATSLTSRIGINTGEVMVSDPAHFHSGISGDAVSIADVLRREAAAGQVLISQTTLRLLGNAVFARPLEASIHDRAGRVLDAWSLEGVIPGVRPLQPRADSPIVGRDTEIEWLRDRFRRSMVEGRPRLAVVIGEAGIGKTRLAMEFTSALDPEVLVATGHCQASGEATTLWPIREIVSELAGGLDYRAISDALQSTEDRELVSGQLARLLGSEEGNGSPRGLFSGMRTLLTALATDRHLVVMLDDVHWAQQTLLDLVDYLAKSMERSVLFLCLARPELVDKRPDWMDVDDVDCLRIEPLDDEGVAELLTLLTVGRPLPAESKRQLAEVAQGNPLFVEQMLAALRDDPSTAIPSTVQALLTARIDRLGPAERDLIRLGSVLGAEFTLGTLEALLPVEAQPSAERHLQTLLDKEMVVRDQLTTREGAYRFRHALIRLAAYRSITKRVRARLHERVAGLIGKGTTFQESDIDQVVGYHLEKAHRYRQELGDVGPDEQSLAVRAGERLARAGFQSFGRFDAQEAEDLLARARTLLPSSHSEHWEVKRKLAEAHQTMGRHEDALEIVSEMLDEPQDDVRLEYALRLEMTRTRLAIGDDRIRLEDMADEAVRAQDVYQAAGDHSGMAQALFVLADIQQARSKPLEMEKIARRGLEHADASGNAREQLGARRLVATAVLLGPTPVPECIEVCERLSWKGRATAAVMPVLGVLRAMLGEFDRARELISRSRRILLEGARARRPLALVARRAGEIELLAGAPDSAEKELRAALDLDLEIHVRDEASHVAAMLASLLIDQDRREEAEGLIDISRAQAPQWNLLAPAAALSARAQLAARRGEFDTAGRLARKAIDQAPDAMPDFRAQRLADLSTVAMAAARFETATQAMREAVGLLDAKGNLVARDRAAAALLQGAR